MDTVLQCADPVRVVNASSLTAPLASPLTADVGLLPSRVPGEASGTVVDISGSGHSQASSSLPDRLILGCHWPVLLERGGFQLCVMCCLISGLLLGDGLLPGLPHLQCPPFWMHLPVPHQERMCVPRRGRTHWHCSMTGNPCSFWGVFMISAKSSDGNSKQWLGCLQNPIRCSACPLFRPSVGALEERGFLSQQSCSSCYSCFWPGAAFWWRFLS